MHCEERDSTAAGFFVSSQNFELGAGVDGACTLRRGLLGVCIPVDLYRMSGDIGPSKAL